MVGGLALFLYGMRIMGDALQRGSSDALKRAMEKVTNSPFTGFLLGMGVTAVIQSSTATIVITSGLVGAGIISLHQTLGIIMGANVGTTMTGQIIRLLDINADAARWLQFFKPSTLAPIAAVAGILLIMAFRFKSSDNVGTICMGFGILFTGLLNMTAAVEPLSSSPYFAELFLKLSEQPVLGFIAGCAVAMTLQSSSATIGILQALTVTGQLSFSSIYSIIIGIYLGDAATTAIVCSIGAKANAKRTGMVQVLFNISEAILVLSGVTILRRLGVFDAIWSKPITSGGIANTHTIFNLICALILLPVCSMFEKIANRVIKDDPVKAKKSDTELAKLDKALLDSPALALDAVHRVITGMATMACGNARAAMDLLLHYNADTVAAINEDEEAIDELADHASAYMVRLSPHLDGADSEKLNYYIQCLSEFERVGDLAVNICESATERKDKGAEFSVNATGELELMTEALSAILTDAYEAFVNESIDDALHIEPLEEVIDDLVAALRTHHIRRLRDGECNVDAGFVFLDSLTNIERIADQCSNVGVHTVALFDHAAAENEHDYISRLHEGKDESYNREFLNVHEDYFKRLK